MAFLSDRGSVVRVKSAFLSKSVLQGVYKFSQEEVLSLIIFIIYYFTSMNFPTWLDLPI